MDVSIETQIIPKLLVVGRIDPRYPYYKVRPLPLSRSYTADNSLNFSGVTSASVDVSIELNKLLFELKHPCITCFNWKWPIVWRNCCFKWNMLWMVFQLKKSRKDLDLLVSIEKRDPETTISSLYRYSQPEFRYWHIGLNGKQVDMASIWVCMFNMKFF